MLRIRSGIQHILSSSHMILGRLSTPYTLQLCLRYDSFDRRQWIINVGLLSGRSFNPISCYNIHCFTSGQLAAMYHWHVPALLLVVMRPRIVLTL